MIDVGDDIVEKAALGDIASFECIYKAYGKFVYNVALRTARGIDAAEEITQEVFMTIHRKLKQFEHGSSLKTWIYRVTVNTTLNYLKKESKHRKKMSEFNEELFSSKNESDLSNDQLADYLLSHLSEEQRVCMVLRCVQQLSYKEIAETLRIEVNAVRSRLKRARTKLLSIKREAVVNGL